MYSKGNATARWILDEGMPNMLCPYIYDMVEVVGNYVLVCLQEKWGAVDKQGETVIPAVYDIMVALEKIQKIQSENQHAVRFENDAFVPNKYRSVVIDGKYCFTYDIERGLLIPCLHGFSVCLTDEYEAALEVGKEYNASPGVNRWGLIESSGRPVLPFIFEDINMLDRNLAKVKFCGKWGIADARISAYTLDE